MCSVGDGFNIDLISDDAGIVECVCNDCESKFKGVRVNAKLKCPECHSSNTKLVWNTKYL